MKTEPEDIPEPDRVPGAPHPRHTDRVIGQDNAIAEFMEAAQGGRLHHAWLLTGPRGVGKATLAWAIARWMLSGASGPFGATDTPEARRVAALSEPRLHLVRRPWDDKAGRLSAQITVDEIRRLLSFFHLSAAEGGRRVAIIDAADDMNLAAANALLKVLEEPPADALILMIAHQPAGLLPTIRSRCRTLRLSPLTPAQMGNVLAHLGIDEDAEALAALSDGSVGEALRLAIAQALAGANATVVYATGAIVGNMLAPDKTLATLPISVFVVGMAACTLPAGLVAQRHGRRAAFLAGDDGLHRGVVESVEDRQEAFAGHKECAADAVRGEGLGRSAAGAEEAEEQVLDVELGTVLAHGLEPGRAADGHRTVEGVHLLPPDRLRSAGATRERYLR